MTLVRLRKSERLPARILIARKSGRLPARVLAEPFFGFDERSFVISFYGKGGLRGVFENVCNPDKFGGVFREHERIMELHLNPDSPYPREARALLLQFERLIPMFKRMGFKGAYGVTPNTTIINFLGRRPEITVIDAPPNVANQVKRDFQKTYGAHPRAKRFVKEKPQLILFRF